MVQDPEAYFRGIVPRREALMQKLEEEAERESIPIVGPVVGELLFILARITGAGRILELGTATGYSTIYLARGCALSDGQVLTLEQDPDMARRAGVNFQTAGVAKRVTIHQGDAIKVLEHMEGPFDMIFMDIDKELYSSALVLCEGIIRPGGLLVADNTGFKDADTFNRGLCESGKWRSVNLFAYLPFHSPENDGLCLAVRV
jgi:predicted O-methyltransferase YrrM